MDIHDDDKPVGRVLTRRELLTLLGGGGLAFALGGTALGWAQGQTPTPTPTSTPLPTCVVKPELSEGPFFVDTLLNRVDVRIDPRNDVIKEGMPLKLIFRVSDIQNGACVPLEGAQVDIWHCDSEGVYSGVTNQTETDELWLRGYQLTDENGIAEFITIYPGWYPGRAVHIHFKIRTDPQNQRGYEFVSQLFFPEDLTDTVFANPPYIGKGVDYTQNNEDGIFRRSEGVLTLELTEGEFELIQADNEDEEKDPVMVTGYISTFDIGLDLG